MAVARTAPKCFICGESYHGIYANRGRTFVGDSFVGWDIDGHKCDRSGLVYFCERQDTHEWYGALSTRTRDPLKARFWKDKDVADAWLRRNNGDIFDGEGRIVGTIYGDCEITEHIFDNL